MNNLPVAHNTQTAVLKDVGYVNLHIGEKKQTEDRDIDTRRQTQ